MDEFARRPVDERRAFFAEIMKIEGEDGLDEIWRLLEPSCTRIVGIEGRQ